MKYTIHCKGSCSFSGGHKVQLATTNRYFSFYAAAWSRILQVVVIYDVKEKEVMHFLFKIQATFNTTTGNQQMYHEFREPTSTAK